jgi:Cu(I)/Ag(I) efflux system protein CusF
MKARLALALAAILLASGAGAQQAPQSEGEVRKVDVATGKVTLRHGPLANLDMPPMTMVFTATDPKLLQGLKQGDKVRFTADKKDGTYLVIAIEPSK